MIRPFLVAGAAVLVYEGFVFAASRILNRNDIADVAWGPGFVVAAAASLAAGGSWTPRGLAVSGLVLAWALRLALHIRARNRGRGEDKRYREWREAWGRWFVLRSFLQVYMLQGVLLVVVAAPVILVNASPPVPLSWTDALGLLVWLAGFSFEAAGDLQLLRFLRDPANRGKLMTEGLWRYTRHPNYFGEVTLWWGIWLFALPLPGGWAAAIGPATITFLILKVSGIPMLERHYEGRPDWEAYKGRTSDFFPMPPRAGKENR